MKTRDTHGAFISLNLDAHSEGERSHQGFQRPYSSPRGHGGQPYLATRGFPQHAAATG
jgi:hypothetical protein